MNVNAIDVLFATFYPTKKNKTFNFYVLYKDLGKFNLHTTNKYFDNKSPGWIRCKSYTFIKC